MSYSKFSTYSQCGEKYRLSYLEGWREKSKSSALIFGNCIDLALNCLLETNDINKALNIFDANWECPVIDRGKPPVDLWKSNAIQYTPKDFDIDILPSEVIQQLEFGLVDLKLDLSVEGAVRYMDNIPLTSEQLAWRQSAYWVSMKMKGQIMLNGYAVNIIPNIKSVKAVQHKFNLTNDANDNLVGFVDAVVEWKDGSIILLDNKTASRDYTENQPTYSPQLLLYYFALQEEFKLDKIGFIVLNKAIRKNRIKICATCGNEGTGGRHKTCANEVNENRCNGKWIENVQPEAYIQVVINSPNPDGEELALSAIASANEGIKKEVYVKNLSSCIQGFKCQFFNVCWNKDYSSVEKKEG